jgi:hypothetical protein
MPDETTKPSVDSTSEMLDKALALVCELSEGKRRWTLSVPVRLDYDPDMVIGGAIRAAKARITELETETERLRHALEQIRWESVDACSGLTIRTIIDEAQARPEKGG